MSIKTSLTTLVLASACLLGQPNVRDVRSAAGNLNPSLPGYGIAPGSLISIAGTTSSDPQTNSFPLSANLNGVSVKIVIGGQELDALMVSITGSRILALVPSQTPSGAGKLQVTDANGMKELDITIVDRNFGIFTQKASSGSVGAAYAVNVNDAGGVMNALTSPAMPGQQIVLLGSGVGASTQDESNMVSAETLSGDFQLVIGGLPATIVSTGRSGLGIDGLALPVGLAGVDSIVATVPVGVSGCRVSVVAITDSIRVSNFATISVSSDGSTCSDPGYLSADDITAIPASGSYNTGLISINRFTLSFASPIGNIDLNTDSAAASFQRFDVGDYRSSAGGNYTSIGSCVVSFATPDGSDLDSIALPTALDAGSAITMKGPKGTAVMKRLADGTYSPVTATGSSSPLFPSEGTPFAEAGAFNADNASGGADVQAFTAKLNNPKPFVWTNQAQITDVTRTEGINVTWTGGANDSMVIISGSSVGAGKTTASFYCTAPASAGSFQVPSTVTLALPPTSLSGSNAGGGALLVLTSTYARFTAPGLDQGIFASSGGSIKTLNYK